MSSQTNLPTQELMQKMKDDLQYKSSQMEASQSTNNKLQDGMIYDSSN